MVYLVVRSLQVVRGAFHDLDCSVVSVFEVLGQPDCRKMSPAQFLDEHVTVDQNLSDMAGVVTTS